MRKQTFRRTNESVPDGLDLLLLQRDRGLDAVLTLIRAAPEAIAEKWIATQRAPGTRPRVWLEALHVVIEPGETVAGALARIGLLLPHEIELVAAGKLSLTA